jgi:hypothetical protein
MTSLASLAKALGGEVCRNQVLCPGPGHSPIDRSLSVRLVSGTPDGFLVHSFAGDDWKLCQITSGRSWVADLGGLGAE